MSSLTVFKEVLERTEVEFEDEGGFLRIGWTSDAGDYLQFVAVRAFETPGVQGEKIEITSIPEISIPEARRTDVAVLFSRMNWEMAMGSWELDFADGQIRFRIGFATSEPLSEPIAQYLLAMSGQETSQALGAVGSLASGAGSVDEAFRDWSGQ